MADVLDPEVQPMETEGRLSYLAFGPEPICSHCDGHFDTHIPGRDFVYYCSEAMLRDKWGDR